MAQASTASSAINNAVPRSITNIGPQPKPYPHIIALPSSSSMINGAKSTRKLQSMRFYNNYHTHSSQQPHRDFSRYHIQLTGSERACQKGGQHPADRGTPRQAGQSTFQGDGGMIDENCSANTRRECLCLSQDRTSDSSGNIPSPRASSQCYSQ